MVCVLCIQIDWLDMPVLSGPDNGLIGYHTCYAAVRAQLNTELCVLSADTVYSEKNSTIYGYSQNTLV